MKTQGSVYFIIIIIWLFASAPVRAMVVSDFDVDGEGWTVVDIAQSIGNPPQILGSTGVVYEASEGNPAGSIGTTDLSGNVTFFSAPTNFLGDASSAFGSTFSYDMRLRAGVAEGYARVLMVGGGLTLQGGTGNVPTTAWQTFGVDLLGASFNVNDRNGPTATDAQLQQVLEGLTGLYIQPDVINGQEFGYLDNVILETAAPIPLPGAFVLFFTALGTLALIRRRPMPW